MAFRWMAERRRSPLNLADFWASLAPVPISPALVNPPAVPGGKGLGIVLAGQVRRRPVLLLNRSDDTAMIYSSKLARGDRLLLPKPEQKLEEGMLSGI